MERVVREAAAAAKAVPEQIAAALPTAPASGTHGGTHGGSSGERWVEFGANEWAAAWLRPDVFEVNEALAVPGLEALADWAIEMARSGKKPMQQQ